MTTDVETSMMRTKEVPFSITSLAPSDAPISWAQPIIRPVPHKTCPPKVKKSREARLLVKFKTLL